VHICSLGFCQTLEVGHRLLALDTEEANKALRGAVRRMVMRPQEGIPVIHPRIMRTTVSTRTRALPTFGGM
jgi:hypothetical protein